jgi:phosphate transport system permease protein
MTALDEARPSTTVPSRSAARRRQQPRPLGTIRTPDWLALVGALAAALSATGLLWTQISPFSGIFGYVVVTWCLFVAFYAVLVSFDENRPTVKDRVASVVAHSLAVLVVAALVDVILYTAAKGWAAMVHVNFYTQDVRSTGPLDPLNKGGVIHAIVGTLIEVGIAMGIAVPLGLLAAVFMHEVPGPFARFVRTVIDAMTAMPDVLAGLFIYATLILSLGVGYSGIAAACALAITAVPIVARAGYVVLRLMPGGLTEASYALGAGQQRTVWHVTLPTVRSGLATAVILGTARAIGETSPVLLTAGATFRENFNPFSGQMMSLPLFAFQSVNEPFPFDKARGFGAATILLVLVVVLFAIARFIGGRGPGVLTGRQQRRVAAGSRRDLARYTRRHAAGTGAAGYPQAGYPQERS